jgi:hypothetical protein
MTKKGSVNGVLNHRRGNPRKGGNEATAVFLKDSPRQLDGLQPPCLYQLVSRTPTRFDLSQTAGVLTYMPQHDIELP